MTGRGRLTGIFGVLALVAGLGVACACHVMKQTPFMAGPDRVAICDREFRGPGSTYSRAQLTQEHDVRVGTVMTWQGRREVWGKRVTIGGAPGCGTGVYLRVREDSFRGYALLGGP